MSDNDMTIGIRAQTDAATFAQAKAAVSELGGAFAKTAADIERSAALDNATKSFVQMAVSEKNAAAAAVELNAQLKALGATDKEVERVVRAFDKEVAAIQRAEAAAAKQEASVARAFEKELAGIQRAEAAAAQKAAADAARAADAVDRAEIAAHAENKARDEIAAHAENDQRNAASGGGGGDEGGGRGALSTFGSQLRSLPSVRIPGLGISTDSIANIARVAGAFQDSGKTVAESLKSAGVAIGFLKTATDAAKVAETTKTAVEVTGAAATSTLAGAETAEAAAKGELIIATTGAALSAGTLLAALAPFAVAGLAAAAVLAALTIAIKNNQAANEAAKKDLESTFAAVNDVHKFADSGATSTDAQARIAQDQRNLATAQKDQAIAQKAYSDAYQATVAENGGGIVGDARARALLAQGVFSPFTDQIALTSTNAATAAKDLEVVNGALASGVFAANDAKVAEEELAKSRSDNALTAADTAGRELAAEQKALENSEEGNKKRLESIDNERAVIDRQIQVLRASGVTSDEVTAKIASLNTQLGSLGKESSFITNTALAVSRHNDALKQQEEDDKKRQKEAEKTQADIAKSEAAYETKKLDLAEASRQKLDDLQTAATNKTFDTNLDYYRDTVRLAEDARSKEAEAQKKFNRDEEDDIRDTNRKLDDLRQKAADDVANDLDARNFLEANKAERGLKKQEDAVLKESERAAEDRQILRDREEEDIYSDLVQARDARKEQLNQQIEDNERALERQTVQAELASERQFAQVELAHNRDLSALQVHMNELTDVRARGYAAEMAAAQGQKTAAQTAANGGSTQLGISAARTTQAGFITGTIGGVRPIATSTTRATTNNINITTDSDQRIIRVLTDAGVLGQ